MATGDEDDDGVLSVKSVDIIVVHTKLDLADRQDRLEKTLHIGGYCSDTNWQSTAREHDDHRRSVYGVLDLYRLYTQHSTSRSVAGYYS